MKKIEKVPTTVLTLPTLGQHPFEGIGSLPKSWEPCQPSPFPFRAVKGALMDREEAFKKWEPCLWTRVECEDKDLEKLVHSYACIGIALRDRTPRNQNSHKEILEKADKQYDEICSMFLKERPIVEIIEALISYAVSLDRIERKLNKLKLARYGKDVDKPEKTKEGEPESEEEALEQYFQTPEFRTIYCSMVEKFIETPPKKRLLWQALEIHYFGRKIGAIWPEEVKETLLGVLDGVACDELRKRQKRVNSKADKFFKERREHDFWQQVHHYVQSKINAGMTKSSALANYYKQHRGEECLRRMKKPESFRLAYENKDTKVIKKSRKIK